MPIFNPIESEIIWSLITISYGIWKERHFVAWSTAIFNLAGFFMVIATIDLPAGLGVVLLLYVGLGAYAIDQDRNDLMSYLGSKPYGALTLAIGLYSAHLLDWLNYITKNDFLTVVGAWLVIAVISHFIMTHYAKDQTDLIF